MRISTTEVTRAGLRARLARVDVLVTDPPHRTWAAIRGLLDDAGLLPAVHSRASAVFARLAEAEARVHGVSADEVHFHEVGALDAIADVVGVCAALDDLGVTSVSAGPVAVGSGHTRGAHGRLPVPVPAVAELARGWRISAGSGSQPGELATPTGMALIRALAATCEDLPPMTLDLVGVGAGGRDRPDRANVVRVLIAAPSATHQEAAVLLEANVDDLDPRLWPGVLTGLLEAGAADAWLVPIIMKKGRPAHTLAVLCAPDQAAGLRRYIFEHTTTLGVRESPRTKVPLSRYFVKAEVLGGEVAVKVGHLDGVIVQAMPEFEDVAALARRLGRPEHAVLREALAAADLILGGRADPVPHPDRSFRH
ncbi:nickel pincer cofactor biosynthesis protein LarC [Actinoplanes sp. NPDC051861]|uniref:nickel pincer cofactor biosynthesis protein LarC n=1 Tax=Actinoplanes sp. NPDC051861 TaxID=3155170 RepID=UPI0034233514